MIRESILQRGVRTRLHHPPLSQLTIHLREIRRCDAPGTGSTERIPSVMPGRRRWPWSCKARPSHGLGQCLFKPSLYFADALARRFPSAPAATQGQGIHPPANVTEVAIPGFAWTSYSIRRLRLRSRDGWRARAAPVRLFVVVLLVVETCYRTPKAISAYSDVVVSRQQFSHA